MGRWNARISVPRAAAQKRGALWLWAVWLGALWPGAMWCSGCGNDLDIERQRPNRAPETALVSGPPDSVDATSYRVAFHWSGTDPDGTVDHFDLILVDHPPIQDHIEGEPHDADPTRVMVQVPEVDDPRWQGTVSMDSVLVTLADTLRRNPQPSGSEDPDDVRQTPFERWHTLFVRAVDDRGLPDPTPDYRSFNSTNIAPTVALEQPVVPGFEFTGPPAIRFRWNGEDVVDGFETLEPVASRYVIIRSRIDLSRPGNKYVGYPESLYALPSRYSWSNWQAWDAADGSGRRAFVSGLSRVGDSPGSGYYLFAVQAKDEAGAISPVFDWTTPGKNNVALVRVSGAIGPLLVVEEPILGMQVFWVGGGRPMHLETAAGVTLRFRWHGDASRYGGTVVAARYGWDLRDPSNDASWDQDWSADLRAARPFTTDAGSHRFYLQVRDDTGIVTEAVYELICYEPKRDRAVLWVDDADHLTNAELEAAEDARWTGILGRLAQENGFEFDPSFDVFDVYENRRLPPPITKLFDYESIIWSVRSGRDGSSGLRQLARFYNPYHPYDPRRSDQSRPYNTLLAYLAVGGKLWINGFTPAKQLWPDERAAGTEGEPVNVTNWIDPIFLDPKVDSLGTISLLYKMGIEMFDVGAALHVARHDPIHYCLGFERSDVPDAPALEVSAAWGQGGTPGRANIEIYNMPAALTTQVPPLRPRLGVSAVLYTYVSGLPADPAQGLVYPRTADGQPTFILAKASPQDAHSSRAFCGFEPFLLTEASHLELLRFLLIGQFRLALDIQ